MKSARVFAGFLLVFGFMCSGGAMASSGPTLDQLLDRASEVIGAPPDKYAEPFLVMSVTPLVGYNCFAQVVTHGMAYVISGDRSTGECNHLPPLHKFVWGRVRHDRVAAVLNTPLTPMSTEYVDIVYQTAPKVKAAHFLITQAEAIPSDVAQ